MSETPQVYEAQVMDIVRNPKVVLAEATEAAKELVKVVRSAKLARKFGGDKEHLFFEAWQTLGKFYGCTPKVVATTYVEFGAAHGFEAHAVVVDRNGVNVSAAEAMCLSDEANWKNKPLFQLKSMAQTRACSKALRNVFAWVAVLAGFEATPAEEMTGDEHKGDDNGHPPIREPGTKVKDPESPITDGQKKAIFAMLGKLNIKDDIRHGYLGDIVGREVKSQDDLTKGEASTIIETLQSRIDAKAA